MFKVPTDAMAPTIPYGSLVRGDLGSYKNAAPKRWDVAIFDPPPIRGQGHMWAMRIVGLPGEELNISGGNLIIDGQVTVPPAHLAYLRFLDYVASAKQTNRARVVFPFKVPDSSYFLLGDNATNANDSRFWGPIHTTDLRGRVLIP